jgi:hypothetical protein
VQSALTAIAVTQAGNSTNQISVFSVRFTVRNDKQRTGCSKINRETKQTLGINRVLNSCKNPQTLQFFISLSDIN